MKKIYTKSEFTQLLKLKAIKMSKDRSLDKKAKDLISHADKYYYTHQTKFLGETSLNTPYDLMIFSEIMYNYKPNYVIELGTAWCGTTLFLSSIANIIGKCKIVGIDIYIPNDLIGRVKKYSSLNKNIILLKGSSSDEKIRDKILKIVKNKSKIMLIVDSSHDHNTVYNELNFYTKLMKKGSYLVCCDVADELGLKQNRNRKWGKGNNSYTALQLFLKENKKRFEYDKDINNKSLISLNKKGYYKVVG